MPKATRAVETAARKIVWVRDGHTCQLCGRSLVDTPHSTHHRINRGTGGSALLERPSILIRACGTGTTLCHGWITEHPAEAKRLGWILPKNNPDIDPPSEPISTIHGWVLLDDNGGRTSVPSPLEVPS